MRVTSPFRDNRVALMLYKAYIRSRLEYNAIVWDPYEDKYTLMLEKIQRKFARHVYRKVYGYYPFLFPSMFVTGMIGLDTLELRRKMLLLVHYYLLLNNGVDNPIALEGIGFEGVLPRRLGPGGARRRGQLLAVAGPRARTCCAQSAPTTRAISLLNAMLAQHPSLDLFFSSRGSVYRAISQFVNN